MTDTLLFIAESKQNLPKGQWNANIGHCKALAVCDENKCTKHCKHKQTLTVFPMIPGGPGLPLKPGIPYEDSKSHPQLKHQQQQNDTSYS